MRPAVDDERVVADDKVPDDILAAAVELADSLEDEDAVRFVLAVMLASSVAE